MTLAQLARQYRESAVQIKKWLKEHENDDTIDKRTESQARYLLREALNTAKYLDTYYQGNRMDSDLFNSIYNNYTRIRNDN